jgi:hypothetical protein
MIQPTHNPQRGPARALLEILTEHPELPALTWGITADGVLRGHVMDIDATGAAHAWASMLGYNLDAPFGYRWNDADRALQSIHTMWRDVPVELTFHSDQPALTAVAA